jgi:hypothetical protein
MEGERSQNLEKPLMGVGGPSLIEFRGPGTGKPRVGVRNRQDEMCPEGALRRAVWEEQVWGKGT